MNIPLDNATLIGSGTAFTLIGIDALTTTDGYYTLDSLRAGPGRRAGPPARTGRYHLDARHHAADSDADADHRPEWGRRSRHPDVLDTGERPRPDRFHFGIRFIEPLRSV